MSFEDEVRAEKTALEVRSAQAARDAARTGPNMEWYLVVVQALRRHSVRPVALYRLARTVEMKQWRGSYQVLEYEPEPPGWIVAYEIPGSEIGFPNSGTLTITQSGIYGTCQWQTGKDQSTGGRYGTPTVNIRRQGLPLDGGWVNNKFEAGTWARTGAAHIVAYLEAHGVLKPGDRGTYRAPLH